MHSSKMRIARLLTVSRSIQGGGCLPWGSLPRGRVCPVGCLPRGCLLMGGVCPGGCLSRGWCLSRGCLLRYTPAPVNRMTDRCKNITLPQTSFAGGNKIRKNRISANVVMSRLFIVPAHAKTHTAICGQKRAFP